MVHSAAALSHVCGLNDFHISGLNSLSFSFHEVKTLLIRVGCSDKHIVNGKVSI